jgi:hypothetical protein
MIVVVDEDRYEFDGSLSLSEAFILYDKASVGVGEFIKELGRANPYVVAALVYLVKRRNKEAVRWEDMLILTTSQIQLLPDADVKAPEEGEQDAKADPTSPRGRTRAKGTRAT